LHIRSFHHGLVNPAMAFPGGYLLLYAWWLCHGPPVLSLYHEIILISQLLCKQQKNL
jgi:hypothetical protein